MEGSWFVSFKYCRFCICGHACPKEAGPPPARRQLYLNYGALSLATKLSVAGHDTVLVHGEHQPPAEILEAILAAGQLPSRYPLMLSIPSYYALPWAQEFCRHAKGRDPDCKIVVGGRWVVGPDPEWFRRIMPEADHVVPGLGESIIESLLSGHTPVQQRLADRPQITP